MKGILYLNSIRDFSSIQCDFRFEITRYPKLQKYPQVTLMQSLAPSVRLLNFFKAHTKLSEDTLLTYYYQYKMELSNSIQAKKDIKYIQDCLDQGNSVQLICFCSDFRYCHRTILGKWFEQKGYSVIYA